MISTYDIFMYFNRVKNDVKTIIIKKKFFKKVEIAQKQSKLFLKLYYE